MRVMALVWAAGGVAILFLGHGDPASIVLGAINVFIGGFWLGVDLELRGGL